MDTPGRTGSDQDNNGRDGRGRFARGNRFARGRPPRREWSEDEMVRFCRAVIDRAQAGDLWAIELTLRLALGEAPDWREIAEGQWHEGRPSPNGL